MILGSRKSHCKHGHERTVDNVDTQGACRQCKLLHGKAHRLANPNASADYSRRYRQEHPDRAKNTNLQVKYGISLKEREAMPARQHNRCAICSTPFNDQCKPVLDHVHGAERVRELLCNSCNLVLGWAKDNIVVLENAIQYLRKHELKLED